MQLKITTDYAIRIVYYLACRGEVITASELAYELKIPESYIPKITKKLKEANIITACEGMHIPQELRIRSRGTERHSASN